MGGGWARSCVLCIDNQAALAALVKGRTASEMGEVLVGVFWAFAAHASALWWVEYVQTESNDANPHRESVTNTPQRRARNAGGPIPEAFRNAFRPGMSYARRRPDCKSPQKKRYSYSL